MSGELHAVEHGRGRREGQQPAAQDGRHSTQDLAETVRCFRLWNVLMCICQMQGVNTLAGWRGGWEVNSSDGGYVRVESARNDCCKVDFVSFKNDIKKHTWNVAGRRG